MDADNIANDRADWLLDAIAGATQNRMFLRGDPEYNEEIGEVILLNAEKAIRVALEKMARKNESLRAVICLADDALMTAIGAFPLPGHALRADCEIIRSISGDSYHSRKERAAHARLDRGGQ